MTKKTTKAELIKFVAKKCDIHIKDCQEIIDTFLGKVMEDLIEKTDVGLNDFGGFKNITKKTRNGVNPRTGEKIVISESKTVKFIPSKLLKESL